MKEVYKNLLRMASMLLIATISFVIIICIGFFLIDNVNEGLGLALFASSFIICPLVGAALTEWIEKKIS